MIPFVSGANLTIEKIDKGSVIISELTNPAVFDFVIDNPGEKDNFEIYSLVGVSFSPKGTFDLNHGENKIEVKAYLNEELRKTKGLISFDYQIRGQSSGIFSDKLIVKVVPLESALDINVKSFGIEDLETKANIKNLQNTNLEEIELHLSSAFFDHREIISLEPLEEANFTIKINRGNLAGVLAGPYVFTTDIEGADIEIDGVVNYLEKESVLTSRENSGVLLRKNLIVKKNEGNTAEDVEIDLTKDVFTRLFTVYSEEPRTSNRNGLFVTYSWNSRLQPGAEYRITATTNYTFPFILVVLVVVIIFFIRIYSLTVISASKKVSFVKTRGGEFALRVSVIVKARREVEQVQIIDTLPGITKLFEGFGRKPDKIEERTRKMFWNLGKLRAGEEKIISYIVYSKIRAVGRFELPSAKILYKLNGKNEAGFSNRAFFVSDIVQEEE